MTNIFRALCAIAALQFMVFASPAPHAGSAQATEADFDVETPIQSASTKADHEKLAAYFEREASGFDAKTALHQRMKRTYRHGGQLRAFSTRMRAHCDKFIKIDQAAATKNREMAKSQRNLTEKAPQ
jgi:hypothetical protein